MTIEDQRLREEMHRAVGHLAPDLDQLTARARRDGLAIRRRRQALTTLGGVAAAGVLVLGGSLVAGLPHQGGQQVGPAASGTATPTPVPQDTQAPTPKAGGATGAGTAAVLKTAVARVADGTATHFRAQGATGATETWASFDWAPSDGSGAGLVEVNLQPGFSEPSIYHCSSWMSDCTVRKFHGGTLMTYEERSPYQGRTGIRRVSDLLRADGVRVVAGTTNGWELPANRWKITRDEPALDYQQLTAVVTDPDFQAEMSGAVLQLGKDLHVRILDDGGDAATPTP